MVLHCELQYRFWGSDCKTNLERYFEVQIWNLKSKIDIQSLNLEL